MRELTALAAREVSQGAACGMVMRPNAALVTVACTDSVAERVDKVQYQLGDGPCLRAMRAAEVVAIPDTSSETRWPQFEAQAVAAGIRSCLSVPVAIPPSAPERDHRRTQAAISFYARTAGAFGDKEVQRATEFAEQASGALAVAERIAVLADVNGQLRASMASRMTIDTAIGIIIARERCTRDAAVDLLKAASQNSNTKLRELAARIVSSLTGEPVQDSVRFDEPSAADTVG